MAKTWVLDTETKGTGAHMVPLETLLRRGGREPDLATVTFTPPEPATPAPSPDPAPLRFKVIDVLSARELGRDISASAAVRLLERMRSVLDARVYVWMPSSGRWRLLTLDDHKLLWRFRGRSELEASLAEGERAA